jgi:predicted nucleotidyltransferase
MPVRSLNSSVLKWPDRQTVHHAVTVWAGKYVLAQQEVLRIGYIGSYARGNWGVGSDLDLVVIVEQSDQPFGSRTLSGDLFGIPVPVDVLIYTRLEWEEMADQGGRFYQTVAKEAVWVYECG